MAYAGFLQPLTERSDIFAFESRDSAENIFDRIIFSDENDVVCRDDEYRNRHKEYYIRADDIF